jgi:hypothetical protein
MSYSYFDFIGLIGVVLIIGTYLLLQLDKLKSDSLNFSLLNCLGAGLILISLIVKFNIAAFVIELFWALISLIGIIRYFKHDNNRSD